MQSLWVLWKEWKKTQRSCSWLYHILNWSNEGALSAEIWESKALRQYAECSNFVLASSTWKYTSWKTLQLKLIVILDEFTFYLICIYFSFIFIISFYTDQVIYIYIQYFWYMIWRVTKLRCESEAVQQAKMKHKLKSNPNRVSKLMWNA